MNFTGGLVSDAELRYAIRAINRQIAEDFAPYWGLSATLRLEGRTNASGDIMRPDAGTSIEARGDAVIYLWDPPDTRTGLGYHSLHHLGMPFGFVFPQVSDVLGEPWSASLSHEALELLADPEVNRMVMGPHPEDPSHMVFYYYEVCDAVQAETYEISGVEVCNFVLPLYFTQSEELGSHNDFLNLSVDNRPLASFGVHPGGYAGYYDPTTGAHGVNSINGDRVAEARLDIKRQLDLTRRVQRYSYWSHSGRTVYDALRAMRASGT
jgi:hypothetical protein